jgi:hypothetical protein
MATLEKFQAMLNEYLPNKLLMEEIVKRDWVLQNVEMEMGWKGSNVVVPFKAGAASSVAMGGLTPEGDISFGKKVRGSDTHKEVWGSVKILQKDLDFHQNGKITEQTFIRIVPDEFEDMLNIMKTRVSQQLLSGNVLATATSNGTAGGVIGVDFVDRFEINQKVTLDDDDSAAADYFVTAIDMNASELTLSATQGGAAANISAYTTAQNAKLYIPGAISESFNSMSSILLSAANGGSATVHGLNKLTGGGPILQALNYSGASWSSSNILTKIFDTYTAVKSKARGNANTVLLSYEKLGAILKLVETQKGPFAVAKQPKASLFGWDEVEINSVKGTLKLVGIQEMSNTQAMFLDLKSWKFYTNQGFKKRQAPDGKEYFEIRDATNGYAYIIDSCLYGQLCCLAPSHNAIVHSIPAF